MKKTPTTKRIADIDLVRGLVMMIMALDHVRDLLHLDGTFGRPKGAASGISLGAVYLLWLAVVALLYPACLWFGQYKASHRYWWLKYA